MNRVLFRIFSLIFVGAICSVSVAGADIEDTSTQIFHPDFKTLKVEVADDFMATPTISLNGDRQIVISFDEMSTDRTYLSYSLYHCNADWKPSQLLEMEYLKGFNKADVDDYGFSRTTFVPYVNYRIVLPNEDMQPLVSGNYLLTVYPEGEPDEIILQARFSVSEESVPIKAIASIHTDRMGERPEQQLEIELDTKALPGVDPFSELIVIVEQNGVPSSRVTTSSPLRVEPSKVTYAHNKNLIYPSGNEWRRFETVRADYPGMHTDSTRYKDGTYHAYLSVDDARVDKEHLYDRTQFGRFKINEYNSTDPNLGADYIDTHFTLDFPQVMNANIYLDGEFTNHLLKPEYRLSYNPDKHIYEGVVPLKQGSYNYRYVAVKKDVDGNPVGTATPSLIEGDKTETINEYHIQVFLRQHGSRADRLVGDTLIYTTF